jgi:predicted Zn finger-like uncharacterized protein
MRVVCDNCGATYKIPDHKLVREVNKATCRKCGHTIIIRKPGVGGPTVSSQPPAVAHDGDSTQISSEAELHARGRGRFDEAVPPTEVGRDQGERTIPRSRPSTAPAPARTPAPAPAPHRPLAPQPVSPKPVTQAPPPVAPPAPQPVAGVPKPQPKAFDPSGDLTLVMGACFAAIVGAGLMASGMSQVTTLIGLAIALAGAVTGLLVLITGDRGRKEAKVVLSMVLGVLVAGIASAAMAVLAPENTEPVIADADPAVDEAGPAFPTVDPPEDPPDEVVENVEDPVEDPPAEPVEDSKPDTPPPVERDAVVQADPDPPRDDPPRTDPTEIRDRKPRDPVERKPLEDPKEETTSGPQGVPVTVLATMLNNNKGVKRCFGLYREETGSLPSGRITVRLTIQPTGKPTAARIDGGAYAGTSLDTCLAGAIKKISFPPWDGAEPATYFYPFIL